MLGITHFSVFLLSCVALSLTPGPDSAFVVARSVAGGRKAGLASALGVALGCCVHLTATVLGLTAILASSVQAFTIVKLVGAAYLVYLGARMLFATMRKTPANSAGVTDVTGVTGGAVSDPVQPSGETRSLRKVFVQGLTTNLLNPKVVLFFVAFFPQFVEPDAPQKSLAFLVLGLSFVAISTLWTATLACAAGTLSTRIGASPRAKVIIDRIVGGVFVGLGVRLALIVR
jgi:threonine/homoserine/homoserine lactone efflux protein